MQLLHSVVLGKGEPLIILHGLFGMGDNWKSLALKFSKKFQVHVVDQRNHGRSFHSNAFSFELMVDDLFNYIEKSGLQKVNLLGHSMGGKTAMLFAVQHPERVNKLIVADIAPKFYPPHHQFILNALKEIDFGKVKSRKEIDEILAKHINVPAIRQFLMKNMYRKTKDTLALRFNLDSLIKNIHKIGDTLPENSKFYGETLFLKGENSGYISEEDKDLIKNHFPNSKIVSIKKAGHWLHAENPTDFFNHVVNFLENKLI